MGERSQSGSKHRMALHIDFTQQVSYLYWNFVGLFRLSQGTQISNLHPTSHIGPTNHDASLGMPTNKLPGVCRIACPSKRSEGEGGREWSEKEVYLSGGQIRFANYITNDTLITGSFLPRASRPEPPETADYTAEAEQLSTFGLAAFLLRHISLQLLCQVSQRTSLLGKKKKKCFPKVQRFWEEGVGEDLSFVWSKKKKRPAGPFKLFKRRTEQIGAPPPPPPLKQYASFET